MARSIPLSSIIIEAAGGNGTVGELFLAGTNPAPFACFRRRQLVRLLGASGSRAQFWQLVSVRVMMHQ